MTVCPKCGSEVTDGARFCGACGAAMGAGPNPPPIAPPVPPLHGYPAATARAGMTPNVAAMLAYIPLCFIGLICAVLFGFVLEPYKRNPFIRFHAWQSIAAHVVYIGFGIAWAIVSTVLIAMAHFLVILTFPVSMLVGLGGIVIAVFLMVKAYGNELFKLPIIGDWAEKQAADA